MLHPDPRGLPALVAVATCWALAAVLYRASILGGAARKLSLLHVVEGITLGFSGATRSG